MGTETVFDEDTDFAISEPTCAWTVRAMTAMKKRLSVNIKLHYREGLLDQGEIFLFNHFARFETFIPQYLIHLETGAYCRSIAAGEFFKEGDSFSNYLTALGGVPNTYRRLLPFLAEEILRGRKVIVFPEGGMVKDRRVIDDNGDYSIYSSEAFDRRKHHTGAAVLGLTLDAFKAGILALEKAGDRKHLERWAGNLGLGGVDELLAAVRRPTMIVPANITFYPIRIGSNVLQRGMEFFAKSLSRKSMDELLIEGNILFKDTDMDIRMGDPAGPAKKWRWWERRILGQLMRRIKSFDELFVKGGSRDRWTNRVVSLCIGRHVKSLRDTYMREMYDHVTVNLSHLASRLILMFVEQGRMEVDSDLFHKILYLAIKNAQKEPSIHLHRSLLNPEAYHGILDGDCKGLKQFILSKACADLIVREGGRYRFLPKLRAESHFDEIRLENLIAVYANEMAPIEAACRALMEATGKAGSITERELATLLFDDELISYRWDKLTFTAARYEKINSQETATESGEPYLLLPEDSNGVGVVLVHGFLASPAELRGFAEKLVAAGHPVIGVRLKGHGTSPWDLRGRDWKNWHMPVRQGHRIMSAFAEKVCYASFSSGGALSLIHAAERPEKLAGIAAISPPLKFRNKNLIFKPLVRGANKLVRWLPAFEGVMPFRPNESENPHINYRNIAIGGLHELRRMVDELARRLPEVTCPVMIIQGDEDTVVDPKSADLICRKLGSLEKSVHMVSSTRHGILHEDIGNTQDTVLAFISSFSEPNVG